MFYLTCRVSHWWCATTRHGLHSPFVYQLVDEVVYQPNKQPAVMPLQTALSAKTIGLVHRLLQYFKPGSMGFGNGVPLAWQQWLLTYLPVAAAKPIGDEEPQLLVCNASNLPAQLNNSQPDNWMLVTDIYANAQNLAQWQALCQRADVRVTINLFSLGLVFFRQGQVKQDFLIRF